MENVTELLTKMTEYKGYVDQARTANTLADVDKAKVEGIKTLNRTLFLLSKAANAIYTASRDRRAELMDEAHAMAYKIAHEPAASKNEEPELFGPQVIEPAEPKRAKKTKKAKK